MSKKDAKDTELKRGAETIRKTADDEMGLPKVVRAPHLYEAIISFLGIVIVMAVGIIKYGADPHIPMFIGVIIAALVSLKIGYKWSDIEGMMIHGISSVRVRLSPPLRLELNTQAFEYLILALSRNLHLEN